jgi:hypothetical protein
VDAYSLSIRRSMALGLLALVLAGGWWLVIDPIWKSYHDTGRNIERTRELIDRHTAILQRKGEVDRRSSALAGLDKSGLYIVAANNEAAVAQLQAQLKELAARQETQVQSAAPLPFVEKDKLAMIGTRLDLSGPLSKVHRLIGAIEQAKPLLFIESAQVRRGAAGSQHKPSEEVVLDIQLEIYAAASTDIKP